jgi:hypothetical protein
MRRLLPALALVALLVAALPGCGSDTKEANGYVTAVNRAQDEFAATFDRLSKEMTATSTPEQDRRTLRGYKTAVDKVVGDLRAVHVPDKVTDLHAQLIAALVAYGRRLGRVTAAFDKGDPSSIADAQVDLAGAVTQVDAQINRTIAAINKKLRE